MRTLVLLSFIPLLAPGSAVAGSSYQLAPFGLSGRVVTSLGIYNALYAGTIDEGVFRRDLADPDAGWTPLGLTGKRIRAVYPHASGPLGFATTVGLQGDPLNPDSALIYCADMDQPPWVVADSALTRTDVTAVWALDGFPSEAICGETFAATIGSAGGVWRRAFSNTQWEFVLNIGFGVGNVVRADPSSGNVWAGGENAVLAPWIARSTDQGDTWQIAYPDLGGDNACNAIAAHPADPDMAYAGMEGLVIRTSNGGQTWDLTGLTGTQAYIYGVALDSGDPLHILAGGTITNPNSWALWESFDGGDTWIEIPPPLLEAPEVASGISAIAADPVRAGTFYLATQGQGVWRHTSPFTGIETPPAARLVLQQNYPNPFNPQTTVAFEIPSYLNRSRVQLAIYTVRGELVRVLVDREMNAGRHRRTWNGVDARGRAMPSGVYYGCLQAGSEQLSLKLHLLR